MLILSKSSTLAWPLCVITIFVNLWKHRITFLPVLADVMTKLTFSYSDAILRPFSISSSGSTGSGTLFVSSSYYPSSSQLWNPSSPSYSNLFKSITWTSEPRSVALSVMMGYPIRSALQATSITGVSGADLDLN